MPEHQASCGECYRETERHRWAAAANLAGPNALGVAGRGSSKANDKLIPAEVLKASDRSAAERVQVSLGSNIKNMTEDGRRGRDVFV